MAGLDIHILQKTVFQRNFIRSIFHQSITYHLSTQLGFI